MSSFRFALLLIVVLAMMPAWVVAGTLDEIAASGEFKLAYRADTPPFSSRGKGGEPEGFTIDLCRIIARDIQAALSLDEMKVTWVPVTAENRFDAIVSGRAHIECGSTTVTLSRQERVDFSNLTYVTGASLMRWADSDIDTVSDLDGRRVSAIAGTTTEKVLKETLDRDGIDAKVVLVGDHAQALQLLMDGKIDAMAGDQATLFGIGFKTHGDDDLVITEDLMSFEPYALPLPRNDADFRLAVNRSLSELYVRGDVGRSWEKWFGTYGVRPTRLLLMLYRLNSFSE
jgi:ABC-type amino acid transport substrate-binding protein